MNLFKHIRVPLFITVIVLIASLFIGGPSVTTLVLILAILEISLSFDNAVVNAKVLSRMSEQWRRIFLTVGVLIAVFGMRLIFPLIIVGITAGLGPIRVIEKAIAGGNVTTPGTYAHLLLLAHPAIAAFGGLFLLMLVLNFFFDRQNHKAIHWLSFVEKPLARIGKLPYLPLIACLIILGVVSFLLAAHPVQVLVAGICGIATYLIVNNIGSVFEHKNEGTTFSAVTPVALAVGKAGFSLFLYIEILDASFSLDGVIGAFAVTSNIFVIAIGLGIGALYIRSLTIYLVQAGTLQNFRFLEHGAHWAIGALSIIMLLSIHYEVPEVVTGLIGVVFIAAAIIHSEVLNRRDKQLVLGR